MLLLPEGLGSVPGLGTSCRQRDLAKKTKKGNTGTSLVVQWLRLHAPSAGGMGFVPGQETRSQMLQLRVCMPQLRPGAAK